MNAQMSQSSAFLAISYLRTKDIYIERIALLGERLDPLCLPIPSCIPLRSMSHLPFNFVAVFEQHFLLPGSVILVQIGLSAPSRMIRERVKASRTKHLPRYVTIVGLCYCLH